jgi:ribonuclease R
VRAEHEVPEDIPVTPRMYQKLAAKIEGKPEERILSYLMLRSLKQARYSEKNEGHFALAAPSVYAFHFADPAVSGFDCASDYQGAAAQGRER